MVEPRSSSSPPRCARCSAALQPGRGDLYLVNIEAIADPYPPFFTDDDLLRDPRKEIERILGELRHLSAEEAMNQVYRRTAILLCGRCYRAWIEDPAGRSEA
jgi:hypothetical protein